MGNIYCCCDDNNFNKNYNDLKVVTRSDDQYSRYVVDCTTGDIEETSDSMRGGEFSGNDCAYSIDLSPNLSPYKCSSNGNLEHISEREPDDIIQDPSLNPTKITLFMQRSLNEVVSSIKKRRSVYDKNVSKKRYHPALLHRSSSTSSILLDDSTVSRPNCKSTVKALAAVIYCHIRNRDRSICYDCCPPCSHCPEIFDERLHSLTKHPVHNNEVRRDPDQKLVYRFVRTLFQSAQLSSECAVVCMIYLERLLTNAEIEIGPTNWKRIVLCAILLASKVWDDQAVWNVDYCQILRDLKVDDVNELERQFLEILQFNINVPSSVYAKYYFDMQKFSDSAQQPFPLSWERALKLEAICRICEDPFNDIFDPDKKNLKRSQSYDSFICFPRFRPAILP